MTGNLPRANLNKFPGGGRWRDGRPRPSDEWRTPPEFFARLNEEFAFATDVACTSTNCLAGLGYYIDQGIDAFAQREPWSSEGPAFLNPSYSSVRPWLERAVVDSAYGVIVCLVPADTGTRWWRDCIAFDATEVRFVIGRMRFNREDGRPLVTVRGGGGMTTPSAVVVYTPAGGPPRYSYIPAKLPAQRQLPGLP